MTHSTLDTNTPPAVDLSTRASNLDALMTGVSLKDRNSRDARASGVDQWSQRAPAIAGRARPG